MKRDKVDQIVAEEKRERRGEAVFALCFGLAFGLFFGWIVWG